MPMLTRLRPAALATLMALLGAGGAVQATEVDEGALIREAFLYTYPLYKLSEYRWTALERPESRTHTTLNRFAHSRSIATPDDRWANSPILDALYSTAWIDLANGPVTLATPDSGDRYYVLTLIDFYSNTFFYAGTRATGNAGQHYWLVGPDWQGEAPPGTTLLRAPTNDVYVNLRVLVDGFPDLRAAHAVQDGFSITPAKTAVSSVPAVVRPQLVPGDASRFVAIINQMLELDPPPGQDRARLGRYAKIGLCGKACRWELLPEPLQNAWRTLYPQLEAGFMQDYLAVGAAKGWIDYNPPGSLLGTTKQRDYGLRASALALGMGMLGLAREEANYWITFRDADGQPLRGTSGYRLHLPPGGIPVGAFWSVSLYTADHDGQFLYANPLKRYHLGSRTPGLTANADGSIDIWLQPTPPKDGAGNWLPTPADGHAFSLFARAYIPGRAVLDGHFRMPSVERLDGGE